MFKVTTKSAGIIIKSFEIVTLYKFIVSNPDFDFQFWKGYVPLTNSEFLKTYLYETKNHQEYMQMYVILNKPISIFDYESNKK